jgi:hypothetical protein
MVFDAAWRRTAAELLTALETMSEPPAADVSTIDRAAGARSRPVSFDFHHLPYRGPQDPLGLSPDVLQEAERIRSAWDARPLRKRDVQHRRRVETPTIRSAEVSRHDGDGRGQRAQLRTSILKGTALVGSRGVGG